MDSDDKDTDIGDEYCTNLNDNFLDLLETAIKNECLNDDKVSGKNAEEVCTMFSCLVIHNI